MMVREQAFTVVREDWATYQLEDGTVLRVKTVIRKVFRVLDADGQPARHPDGEPRLQVTHAIHVVATPAQPQAVTLEAAPSGEAVH